MNDEIIALETKLSYLEDFVTKLQEVSVEHTKIIERLKAENEVLLQKVKDLSDQLEGDISNRKPPHY